MSTLKADTIQSTSGGAATLTKQEAAKAWSYSGLDDNIIDDSFNTASLTDHGTGTVSHNFSNSFSSANHCNVALIGTSAHVFYNGSDAAKSPSTTGNFRLYNTSNSFSDAAHINIISIGDLA
tara:strand:+ start:205 stop:570 length:366 start_codon:yes stop_codon:yes gene_type:complete